MYIARLLYPVNSLGPGNRLGLWFMGCPRRCPGCCSPEMQEISEKNNITLYSLLTLIAKVMEQGRIDGFTLSGGDPFYQPDALRQLLPELNKISNDILVYTGYAYADLRKDYADILKQISVLIDGEYVDSLNNGSPLRGSDNQTIYYLKEQYKPVYEDYLVNNTIRLQEFPSKSGISLVGIPQKDFKDKLKEKGIEFTERV